MRYRPASTPRPSGDQGKRPNPNARTAGITSTSARRASDEYSTWALVMRARPGNADCQVAACAVCQPTKFDTPAYRTMPALTAWSMAARNSKRRPTPRVQLPQIDVIGVQPAQRAGEVVQQRGARGVDHTFAVADAEAGLGGDHDIVAGEVGVNQSSDDAFGLAVAVGRGGVDQGAARLDRSTQQALGLGAGTSRPQVSVPRPSRETCRPLLPGRRFTSTP